MELMLAHRLVMMTPEQVSSKILKDIVLVKVEGNQSELEIAQIMQT